MNPIVLLALGGVALMAMRKKKPEPSVGEDCASWGPSNHVDGEMAGHWVAAPAGDPRHCVLECMPGFIPNADETACVRPDDAGVQDHIVEEGIIGSLGGVEYSYRIWRMFSAAAPFVGEILLDAVWTSGPMAQTQTEVQDGLQQMVDSLDVEEASFHGQAVPTDPCAGEFAGPFLAMGYDEIQGVWAPFPNEPQFDNTFQPERRWCVVSYLENGLAMNEGRVMDDQGIIYATGSEPDPNVAASKALWVSLYGPAEPRPWPETGGPLVFDMDPGP